MPSELYPKMIVPSRFQDPPRTMPGISHSVCGGPPLASTFLSVETTPNAMKRLSGDQKGRKLTPSVPGSARDSNESSDRTHSVCEPVALEEINASRLPSGERAMPPLGA